VKLYKNIYFLNKKNRKQLWLYTKKQQKPLSPTIQNGSHNEPLSVGKRCRCTEKKKMKAA
jgi:hypothetical protein